MPSARPSKAVICNAIAAAQKCGLDVTGVEITPQGGVRVLAGDAPPALTSSREVDAWDTATGAASCD
jgi:hypothetical protein